MGYFPKMAGPQFEGLEQVLDATLEPGAGPSPQAVTEVQVRHISPFRLSAPSPVFGENFDDEDETQTVVLPTPQVHAVSQPRFDDLDDVSWRRRELQEPTLVKVAVYEPTSRRRAPSFPSRPSGTVQIHWEKLMWGSLIGLFVSLLAIAVLP